MPALPPLSTASEAPPVSHATPRSPVPFMPDDQCSAASRKPWLRSLGIAIALLGWVLCLLLTVHRREYLYSGIDFRSVYASSRCLVADCNPYSESETMQQFLSHGGSLREAGPPPKYGPFLPYYAGYPPVTLFYAIPLAVLRWPIASLIWRTGGFLLYGFAVFLFADLCTEDSPLRANFCLACFLFLGSLALELANPALPAAALCSIGLWCLLQQRHQRLGVLSFAFSIALKPHLGGMILLYLLLASPTYRRRAWQILAATLLICLPALAWTTLQPASRHWLHDYTQNVKNVATVGNLSDPGPTNWAADKIADLQTITSVIRNDPAFYNHLAWAVSLVLLILWLVPVIRLRPSREKDLLSIAAIATFSLLPFYHRSYDSRLLLVVFPAFALLMHKSARWGAAALTASLALAVMTSDDYGIHLREVPKISSRWLVNAWNGRLLTILYERQVALILLVVTLFFLAALYRAYFEQQRADSSGVLEDIEQ